MKTLFGFFLLFMGGMWAINPEAAWQWEIGWKVKEAEPSDAYLLYIRITGIISSIIGLILIFIW